MELEYYTPGPVPGRTMKVLIRAIPLFAIVLAGTGVSQLMLSCKGLLSAEMKVEASAPAAGEVTRFDKPEGAWVSAGEPVAWIGDKPVAAPASGQIQRKVAANGVRVQAKDAVFVVADNSRLLFECPAHSAFAAGQSAIVTGAEYPGVEFQGRVIAIAPKLQVRVPNAGGKLKAGMAAEARIRTGN
jgi:hypothetical protein